jgi:prepilin-type N-terminal cleavage/methylation domain-containing protein
MPVANTRSAKSLLPNPQPRRIFERSRSCVRNSDRPASSAGFTLIEIVVAVAIASVLVAVAIPATGDYRAKQRLNASARSVAKAFSVARGEAARTGDVHLVFFGTDTAGSSLTYKGPAADIVVVNDGAPGEALQNCSIDSGETVAGWSLETGVVAGNTGAGTTKATNDGGAGSMSSGSTFTQPGGAAANWVMFLPRGVPVSFKSDCTTGANASGGGAIYLTNGKHDAAVVLTPLGANRQYRWSGAAWQD